MRLKKYWQDRINHDIWEVLPKQLPNPYNAVLRNCQTGELVIVFIEYIEDEFDRPPRLFTLLWEE